MKTYNTRKECYAALMTQAKSEGSKDARMTAPNSGSERIEIPEVLHGMGLEMTLITVNDKGNPVVRTKTIYGLFADFAGWY